jgi:CheY-like chemotaxis protein
LYLPALNTPAAPVVAPIAVKDRPAPAKLGTILLVEDDELVRDSVANKLMRLGYTVTSTSSATEAIATLERDAAFDLIFTDVIMPGNITGADLARIVQSRWPGISILATSGYTETTMLGKIKLPTGVRLLSKPYSNKELAQTLTEVMASVPS